MIVIIEALLESAPYEGPYQLTELRGINMATLSRLPHQLVKPNVKKMNVEQLRHCRNIDIHPPELVVSPIERAWQPNLRLPDVRGILKPLRWGQVKGLRGVYRKGRPGTWGVKR